MKYFFLFLALFSLIQISSFANPLHSNENNSVFENIIILKTKEKQQISSGIAFENKELNKLLKPLDIISIKQKFSFFQNNKSHFNDKYGLSRIYEIRYKNKISPLNLSKILSKSNLIEYSSPVYKPILQSIPNDSLFSKQKYLSEIFATDSWNITTGDSNIVIAIIDTEIDNIHEDLVNNIWQNPGEFGLDFNRNDKRFNGIDDDENGKIDDWHGWDFLSDVTYEEEQQGIIREDNDTRINSEYSPFFHGTNVAGAASATTNNKIGISSIGFNTKILPIKVQSDNGVGWRASEGILYAAMLGADIINCSWLGLGRSDFEFDVIRQVTDMGCLIVAAAGNSSECINEDDIYIRNSKYVLYVGGTDGKEPADLSNYGIPITNYSPAISILTTSPNNKYEEVNGTSLSSPICAGIAALIKSIHKDWAPEQIRHQIRSSSDSFNLLGNLFDKKNFFGKANSFASLKNNRNDFFDSPVPGIECISFSSKNGSDTLSRYTEVIYKFSFKNFLADANNIEITFESMDSLLEISPEIYYLEQIKHNEASSIEVTLKVSEKAKWYYKNSKLLISINADNYINYQLVNIPLRLVPRYEYYTQLNQISTLNSFSFNENKISGISSPNQNCLWVCGFSKSNIPFSFVCDENYVLYFNELNNLGNEFSEIMIEGISNYSALISLKKQDNSYLLLLTENQGCTWEQIELNFPTIWNIGRIHFFNEKNGIILANTYFVPYFQIFLSTDGGLKWELSKPRLSLSENESPQLPKTFTQYENIYIPTNKARFFYSTDFGNIWNLTGNENSFSVSNFYMNKNTAYSYCNDTSGSFLALTEDSGINWKYFNDKSFHEYFNFPVSISGANTKNNFLLVNEKYDFLISNKDFNFFPVKFNKNLDKINLLEENQIEIIQSANKSRVWFVCNGIHFFDLDNIFNPIDSAATDDFIKTLAYPNPLFGNSAFFQIYLTKEKLIKLELTNSLGQIVKVLYNAIAPANLYFTIQWNSSALPSGKYYYKLTVDGKVDTKPLIIVR